MNPMNTLLLGIPTGILHLYGSLGLQGRYLPIRRLLLWGVLLGLTIPLYRAIPGFGLHVPLFALTQILFVRFLGGGSWGSTLLTSLVINLSVPVGEGLLTVPVFNALGIPMKTAMVDPWFRLLGGWIGNIPLVLICAVILVRHMRQGSDRA